ncbi:peptide deformylase [Allonocardiopsis opalescens]|uniref:Peptide deformylase n=1 Tax=Allonocardiopsis opalescens TaxID=1144618 RepID=A0A2T0QAZ7_9ACTN|nr:peptide deformylase [Allonocardiopsis opalescens]PRY00990.1 peptide deformylase [Allonocardiopsis opalescens]
MPEIRRIGDPVLRTPAEPVTAFDRALRALVDELFAAMYAVDGAGLAAPQLGTPLRVFVYDIGNRRRGHVVNPELTVDDPDELVRDEACLSVPGQIHPTPRAAGVTVRGRDRMGRPVSIRARGQLARCFQHETDHLDGKLYLDRLSPAVPPPGPVRGHPA